MTENTSASKLFKTFINDIVDVFPEYKNRLLQYYGETIQNEKDDDPKIIEFLKNIDDISEMVINKDITLFDKDPIILQNVSFKLLWNTDNISDQTKNSIWKYLQTFCIINIKEQSEKEKIEEVIKSIESKVKIKDKETLKKMKKLQKLNETFDIAEIEKVIEQNPKSIDQGMNEMDKMFENTSIGKIAKEITEELDIDNIINGGGGIQDLFNPNTMGNIMKTINAKMSTDENGLNSDNLMEEASTICNSMQKNPLFSSLMGMQNNIMSNMAEGMKNETVNKDTRQINLDNKNHNPGVVKARLQNKLKEKTIVDKKS